MTKQIYIKMTFQGQGDCDALLGSILGIFSSERDAD